MWVDYSLLVLVGFLTVLIAYQDFKFRLINLWLIIFYCFAVLIYSFYKLSIYQLLVNGVFVFFYLFLCWLVLKVLYFKQHQRWETMIDTKIGLADVILIFITGIYCEPLYFLVLTVGYCFMGMIYYMAFRKKTKSLTIPLAAIIGLVFYTYLLFQYLYKC